MIKLNLFLTIFDSEDDDKILNIFGKKFTIEPISDDGLFFSKEGNSIYKIFSCIISIDQEDDVNNNIDVVIPSVKKYLNNNEINYISLVFSDHIYAQAMEWETNPNNNISQESLHQIDNLLNPNGKLQCRKK